MICVAFITLYSNQYICGGLGNGIGAEAVRHLDYSADGGQSLCSTVRAIHPPYKALLNGSMGQL
jgi:hypothetical protein